MSNKLQVKKQTSYVILVTFYRPVHAANLVLLLFNHCFKSAAEPLIEIEHTWDSAIVWDLTEPEEIARTGKHVTKCLVPFKFSLKKKKKVKAELLYCNPLVCIEMNSTEVWWWVLCSTILWTLDDASVLYLGGNTNAFAAISGSSTLQWFGRLPPEQCQTWYTLPKSSAVTGVSCVMMGEMDITSKPQSRAVMLNLWYTLHCNVLLCTVLCYILS